MFEFLVLLLITELVKLQMCVHKLFPPKIWYAANSKNMLK